MILRIVAVLIALLVSSSAQSEYITFQIWAAQSEIFRVAYIAGTFDSFTIFSTDEEVQRLAVRYEQCLGAAKMLNDQLATNVMNFAKDKPELQVGSVQAAMVGYLNAACGKPPAK